MMRFWLGENEVAVCRTHFTNDVATGHFTTHDEHLELHANGLLGWVRHEEAAVIPRFPKADFIAWLDQQ